MNNKYDLQVKNLTQQLIESISKKEITLIEKKRMILDLYAIQERLEKKEYQKANFSSNKFDIEDRNHQVFIDLEFYCLVGKTWSYIFDAIEVKKNKTVADICAGYSPKVELGLYYAGYKQRVELLDKSIKSSAQLIRFIDLIKAPFTLHARKFDILEKSSFAYDVVVGNHIIDDIVIDYFAQKFGINTDDLYMKESKPKELWSSILKNEDVHARKIIDILTPSLASLVKNGGYLAISHYESYSDRLLELQKATIFNKRILREISQILCNNFGFIDEHAVLSVALDNKNGHFTSKDCTLLCKESR